MQFVIRITLILLAFLWSSCSVFVNCYVKNLSNEDKTIFLIKSNTNSISTFVFKYTRAKIKKLKFGSVNEMSHQINGVSENGVIKLRIPSDAILYLGKESILREMFDKVVVQGDTISIYKFYRGEHVSKQFPNKFAVWYDIR